MPRTSGPALCLLLLLCGAGCGPVFHQRQAIYAPRPYSESDRAKIPPAAEPFAYRTEQGEQTAIWIPPATGAPPEHVWFLFSGKGSLATDWMRLVGEAEMSSSGFLAIHPPGYGDNQGRPSPQATAAASAAAFDQLAKELKMDRDALRERSISVGYSLGAAGALQFADDQGIRRVILMAPFTSLSDMARRQVGRPLSWGLHYQYDNRHRVQNLVHREPLARIVILHGTADDLIPFSMGEELAQLAGPNGRLVPLEGAPHGTLLDDWRPAILKEMHSMLGAPVHE